MALEEPLTPPVRSPVHAASGAHDSPYSDYFTDEGRSSSRKHSFNMPAPRMRHVLRRLNNIGGQILRQRPSETDFEAIGDKLDELESTVGNLDHGSRPEYRMSDSGYVEGEAPAHAEEGAGHVARADGHQSGPVTPLSESEADLFTDDQPRDRAASQHSHRDQLLANAQSLLQRVSQANNDLRARFEEMRDLNDKNVALAEEKCKEADALRAENEAMKTDLAFDHSELLYLQLQLKALELQVVQGLREGGGEGEGEGEGQGGQATTETALLESQVEQLKSVWDDVNARLRSRRVTHKVLSSDSDGAPPSREDGRSPEEKGGWKLDIAKRHEGRVQSITIRRISSSDGTDAKAHEEGEDEGEPVADTRSEQQEEADLRISAITTVYEEGDGNKAAAADAAPTETEKAVQTPVVAQAPTEEETRSALDPDGADEYRAVKKSAWRELMESLADLSGMTDR